MKRILSSLIFALFTLLLLTGCDAWSDTGQDPIAARILDVGADPNPVTLGDTTRLFVVHTDSTETGFSYIWKLPETVPFSVTDSPYYDWVVPQEPGEYRVTIAVRRTGFTQVQEDFMVTVASE